MVHLGIYCSQQISNANQRKMVIKDELFKLFPKLEEENKDDREEENKDDRRRKAKTKRAKYAEKSGRELETTSTMKKIKKDQRRTMKV
jgi:hypothetical protein